MTSLPAQTFRLTDRGLLREGFAADIVVFDPAAVSDRATFEQPHQYPAGISQSSSTARPSSPTDS